jgi:ABC-2 type transport system permease protein
MWFRLKIAVVKEVLSYMRDPTTRRFMIGAPIFQTIVFAFAGTLDVRNVDVAIYDQDNGRWSHELIARVDGAWFTDRLVPLKSLEELHEQVSMRRVLMAIHLAPDFSRNIAAGQPAQVQVIVDGRRANAGQIATSYLNTLVAELGADLVLAEGGRLSAPEAELRHWFNPNLNYRWFMVINLCGVLGMMMCLVVTSLSIAREREMGTFDQLLVSPMTSLEIIVAKTMPGMIAGTVVSGLVTLLAVFVFGAPFSGNPFYYLIALIIFVLSVVGVGLFISSVSNTQQQAILGTFFGSTPFVLTSGFATPVENMPGYMQVASLANPLRHYLDVVQGSFFKAHTAEQMFANAWPLIPIALVTLGVATVVVRRKLQ